MIYAGYEIFVSNFKSLIETNNFGLIKKKDSDNYVKGSGLDCFSISSKDP